MDGLLGEDEDEEEEEFLQPYIVSNPFEARELTTRWKDGWMDRWMDGWMDGWMDEWMDVWMDSNSWREVIHTSAR